ncbi:MAG: hypothetical protein JWO45_639, partial [Spartobacteria bacterium]|nr:hypothetical protein [Spartobacteria bacterium]
VASVRATTVIPPTFDDLVDQAEFIFDGTVTNVKSEWVGEGAERHIMTYVSFRVEESLKGKMEQTYTIRMLGGTVDGKTMAVSDAPKFKSGDRDILFVQNNGTQFIPLVGIMHGRFRVAHDQSGNEMMTTNDGQPLKNVARLGRSETASADEPTLTPASFKAAIQNRLRNAP